MTERVGTIYTMAPQVLQGIYSSKADLWSVGVMIYMLLSSSKPFYSRRRRQMIDLIMRGDYRMDAPVWKEISEPAKDLVAKLLVVDPKKRLTAQQALQHPWLATPDVLPDHLPDEAVLRQVDDSLLNYKQTSALKRYALNVIAHRSTSVEIQELRKAFDHYDTEKNGVITFSEFREALKEMNYPEETLKEIFSSIDVNKNGHIQYTEFLAATLEAHGHIQESKIAQAFDRLDCDDTGYISKQNLKDVLGKEYTPELADGIFAEADLNQDGRISYKEFLTYFRKQTTQMANTVAHMETQSLHQSEVGLLGLDAKIPGGRFDSHLDASLQKQLEFSAPKLDM